MKSILFFDEFGKEDIFLVGGKGANLGEMTRAGFLVPYGFCVTTKAFSDFLCENNFVTFLNAQLLDADLNNIKEIGIRIREKLLQGNVPEYLNEDLRIALEKFDENDFFSVRSSATAEDLAVASFAGQQDTYLNIMGFSCILDAIKRCWVSLFTDRAILYRIQNNIDHKSVFMGVVVQIMVNSDYSGIVFTADPVSGSRDIISINASYGLGEAIVFGMVSPDLYKFSKSKGSIIEKNISEKKIAVLSLENGGTKISKIPNKQSRLQVLNNENIFMLAETCMKIETHYGCPQDIEWSIKDEQLYILQSRAITTLFPMLNYVPKDHKLHVYMSLNHIQVMTEPVLPMGMDCFCNLLRITDKDYSPDIINKAISHAGGKMYIDISIILQSKFIRKLFIPAFSNIELLISEALKKITYSSCFDDRIYKNSKNLFCLICKIIPVLFISSFSLFFKNHEKDVDQMNIFIRNERERYIDVMKNAGLGVERLKNIYRLSLVFNRIFKVLRDKIPPAIVSLKIIEKLERRWFASDNYSQQIQKGLVGNITTEMGLLIGDIADIVRRSPKILSEFENSDYKTLIYRINSMDGEDYFKRIFNDFFSLYGVRTTGELDISRPRWIENPKEFITYVLSTVKTAKDGTHRIEYKKTIETAMTNVQEFIRVVEQKKGKCRAYFIRHLINVFRYAMPVREHHKLLMMMLLYEIKKALLDESRVIVSKGNLEDEEDVFYLFYSELYLAIQNNTDLRDLVKQRKEEYKNYKKLFAPRVLTSDGEEIKAEYKINQLKKVFVGVAVSSGVIEGIAKVITDPANEKINKGEILVAPFTDPGWTPLFINAIGLVTETGGLLTHGSVVAREYGIPAVLGVEKATVIIKTGQRIRVNGDLGYVELLDL